VCSFCSINEYFDVQGGRTRELCDKLSDAGYMVLLPDFFRGDSRVGSFVRTATRRSVLFLFNLQEFKGTASRDFQATSPRPSMHELKCF
jgi:dienelactone hydrolase